MGSQSEAEPVDHVRLKNTVSQMVAEPSSLRTVGSVARPGIGETAGFHHRHLQRAFSLASIDLSITSSYQARPAIDEAD